MRRWANEVDQIKIGSGPQYGARVARESVKWMGGRKEEEKEEEEEGEGLGSGWVVRIWFEKEWEGERQKGGRGRGRREGGGEGGRKGGGEGGRKGGGEAEEQTKKQNLLRWILKNL